MNKKIAYLGMDVHKNSITLVLFVEQRKEEEFTKKIANNLTIKKSRLIGLMLENLPYIYAQVFSLQLMYQTNNRNGTETLFDFVYFKQMSW
jgi:hypothetical protein